MHTTSGATARRAGVSKPAASSGAPQRGRDGVARLGEPVAVSAEAATAAPTRPLRITPPTNILHCTAHLPVGCDRQLTGAASTVPGLKPARARRTLRPCPPGQSGPSPCGWYGNADVLAPAGVMPYRRSLTPVELRYLYVGSSNVDEDLPTWLALPGARLRWRFRRFGADVAAVDLGAPPVVLVADHRPAGSVLPIFAVADLDGAVTALADAWTLEVGPMGTPEGPACVVRNDGGATIALLQLDRRDALDGAFTAENPHAVLPSSPRPQG